MRWPHRRSSITMHTGLAQGGVIAVAALRPGDCSRRNCFIEVAAEIGHDGRLDAPANRRRESLGPAKTQRLMSPVRLEAVLSLHRHTDLFQQLVTLLLDHIG